MDANLENLWRDYSKVAAREWKNIEKREGEYPHYSEGDRWRFLPVDQRSRWISETVYDHGNWSAGFWLGLHWLLRLSSEDELPFQDLMRRLDEIATRADDTTTHDLGFIFYPSFALGHRLGFLNGHSATPALRAAELLARRFNTRGAFIQAFGPVADRRSSGTSTIDTMMNLPLIWWAASQGVDPVVFDVGRLHARTAARLFLRGDGSSYHLNRFNPTSGALEHRGTFQGAAEDSCWSRGQGWAIAGFAWAYAATAERELLDAADLSASYYWDRLPESGIPPWDFSDRSADATKDSSASAIAAMGALALANVHSDNAARKRYDAWGKELLAKLGNVCLNLSGDADGILLHSCYSKPHGLGLDGATAWGDFFFGLALAVATNRLTFDPQSGGDPLRIAK